MTPHRLLALSWLLILFACQPSSPELEPQPPSRAHRFSSPEHQPFPEPFWRSTVRGPIEVDAVRRATSTQRMLGPTLAVDGGPISFSFVRGSPAPAPQLIAIGNNGVGALRWSVVAPPCVRAEPDHGEGEREVSLYFADDPSLAPGDHAFELEVVAANAAGSPIRVPIAVHLEAQPVLAAGPSELSLNVIRGVRTATSTFFSISNLGGGSLTWRVLAPPQLTVTPASGVGSAHVEVRFEDDGTLAAGAHQLSLAIEADNAASSPTEVPVHVHIERAPQLEIDAAPLRFVAVRPTWTSTSAMLPVRNGGGHVLRWTAAATASWLALLPRPDGLELSIVPENVPAIGEHFEAQLTVNNLDVAGDVWITTIELEVTDRASPPLSNHLARNAAGDVTAVYFADGSSELTSYDAAGFVSRLDASSGEHLVLARDAAQRPASVSDGTIECLRAWDQLGRLGETRTGLAAFQYSHTADNTLSALQYPDGFIVNYQQDGAGRLTRVTWPSGQVTYAWDGAGRLSSVALPNGVITQYFYTPHGALRRMETRDAAGALLAAYQQTLDANGRRVEEVVELPPTGAMTTAYSYDGAGRLIAVVRSDGTSTSYVYDLAGRRTARIESDGTITEYEYDNLGRMVRAGDQILRWDRRGRLIARISPSERRVYFWDSWDRLVRVETPSGVIEYAYAPNGERIERRAGTRVERYAHAYAGAFSRMSYRTIEQPSGTEVRRVIAGLGALVEMTPSGSRYFLSDLRENMTGIIDDAGVVTSRHEYSEFGELLAGSVEPYGFRGEEQDVEAELVFLRKRWYAPSLGIFLSRDPAEPLQELPDSWDTYRFAFADPINLHDPGGDIAQFILAGALAGAVIGAVSGVFGDLPRGYSRGEYIGWSAGYGLVGGLAGSAIAASSLFGLSATTLGVLGAAGGNLISQGLSMANTTQSGFNPTEFVLNTLTARLPIDDAVRAIVPRGPGRPISSGAPTFFERYAGDLFGTSPRRNFLAGWAGQEAAGGALGFIGAQHDSSRGGVRLDRAAQVFANLGNIRGATFDRSSGQIVLFGDDGGNVALPPMQLEDLIVLARSIYRRPGEFPGVTMGNVPPPPGYETEQGVAYFGGVENTYVGWVFFEADRTLKILTLGENNLDGTPITSSVPGYRSLLERHAQRGCTGGARSTRMWFVPGTVSLARSSDQQSMTVEQLSVLVLTESTLESGVVIDQDAEDFAAHFRQNYQLYAQEFPVLAELERLVQIAAVLQWMRDSGVPFDVDWLLEYPIPATPTPFHTPTHSVSVVTPDGRCLLTATGGVDLQVAPDYVPVDPAPVEQLSDEVVQARPIEASTWTATTAAGETQRAVAMTAAPSPLPGHAPIAHTDLSLVARGPDLVLARYCTPGQARATALGYCWQLEPAAIRASGALDRLAWPGAPYGRLVPESVSLVLRSQGREVTFERAGLIADSLVFDPLDHAAGRIYLAPDDSWSWATPAGEETGFDASGQLIWQEDAAGNRLDWVRGASGQLLSIEHDSGAIVSFARDAADRITAATASSGARAYSVLYTYDAAGDLSEVRTSGHPVVTIAYDRHRPTTSLGLHGAGASSYTFDDQSRVTGMVLADGASVSVSYSDHGRTAELAGPEGTTRLTHDERGRPLQVERDGATLLAFGYTPGVSSPTSITDVLGRTSTLRYDAREALVEAIAAGGAATRIYYNGAEHPLAISTSGRPSMLIARDATGQPASVQVGVQLNTSGDDVISYVPSGVTYSMEYSTDGELSALVLPSGGEWQIDRDAAGQPAVLRDPAGVELSSRRDAEGRLERVQASSGAFLELQRNVPGQLIVQTRHGDYTVEHDERERVLSIATPNNAVHGFVRDPSGAITSVVQADGGATIYERDALGRLVVVTDPGGVIRSRAYDANGALVRETFGGRYP